MWATLSMLAVASVGLVMINAARDPETAAIGAATTATGGFLAFVFALVWLFD